MQDKIYNYNVFIYSKGKQEEQQEEQQEERQEQ